MAKKTLCCNDDPVPVQAAGDSATAAEQQRCRMIAEAAYYRAEQRGFAGGDPIRDWLEAEAEINAMCDEGGSCAD